MDLTTSYLGLTLRNPIVVGSCGLSDSVDKIRRLDSAGAGAVVLKSLFEEEIAMEFEDTLDEIKADGFIPEYYDYFDYQIKTKKLEKYLELIREAKRAVSIPIIASVNCVYSHEWAFFAKELQNAGADALELNVFLLPADVNRGSQQNEELYFKVVETVQNAASIPIALKMSYYFSNLGQMIQKLSQTGLAGLVLFNRFYSPDFDVDEMKVIPTHVLSSPAELTISLRWIALMSGRVQCDLAASTGVHDGRAVVKQLLAGADVVQVASALYRHGPQYLQQMLQELTQWMAEKKYTKISDFRGLLSQAKSGDPGVYERVQFMKYFAEKDKYEESTY
ncbi:MAG: dihydroorotate dehydrogenase-like protein [Acidobacteria bacterium]|nr:dihydroorotate dehydrogenase-like protein [Acidobacteriota bacterium]